MKSEHKALMKARKRNIRLTVAYDGTAYHGFQRQTPPVVAVQNVLEEKLTIVFGDTIELAASGRTDAGVHAHGQVVNFFTDGTIPVDRVCRAMNSILPEDIVVTEAAEADRDFSALHSAKRKTYIYRILTGEVPCPFERNTAWYIRRKLDIDAMKSALSQLIGTHDYSAFRAAGGAPMSPVRTMDIADIEQEGRIIRMTFRADGFLYHMVRNIVGTVVDVGLGVKTPEQFGEILASLDRQRASATAPACGLYLECVEY